MLVFGSVRLHMEHEIHSPVSMLDPQYDDQLYLVIWAPNTLYIREDAERFLRLDRCHLAVGVH